MLNSTEDLAVLALAVALDLTLGELPTRLHPTVWMGHTVAFLQKPLPKKGLSGVMAGGVMAALVVGLWATAAFFATTGLKGVHPATYIVVGALLLKSTFAIKMLHQAAARVREPLNDWRLGPRSPRATFSCEPGPFEAFSGTNGGGGRGVGV